MSRKKGRNFQRLEIGLASPIQIRNWAERYLPNGEIVGEVTSWETVNYKTLKPEPNGLFCQRIFGPVIDYTCACGKKATKIQIGFCPKCGVERTTSRVRRYRLGYIKLKQPVVQTLYATYKPSPLSLCLDWSNKRVQAVMYGTEFCHLASDFKLFSSRFEIFQKFITKQKVDTRQQNTNLTKVFPITRDWNRILTFLNIKKTVLIDSSLLRLPFSSFSKKNKNFLRFGKISTSASKLVSFRTQNRGGVKNFVFSRGFAEAQCANFLFAPSHRQKSVVINRSLGKGGNSRFATSTKQQSLKKKKFSFLKIRYPGAKLELGLHLYGVAYDMTWRQVEDLQEFLLYGWEHSLSFESFIPSYAFTTKIENKLTSQIPFHNQYYPIQTGGFVYQKVFSYFDLINFQRQLKVQYQELKYSILYLQQKLEIASDRNRAKKGARLLFDKPWEKEKLSIVKKLNRLKQSEKKCLRRLHYFRDFQLTNMQPAWMILSYLPVLPPGLRPITSIRGELIVSDINSLYRKVLTRNKRLINTSCFGVFDTALSGSWASWCYNLRQVQESVDNLLKSGSIESGKISKSLLDALKGKKGRFRQHLLGKRVDYSGRSVIVVGPSLKIHECGIPKHMAIELFQPFIIQRLRNKGIVFTTTAAKAIISERKPIIWTILKEILKNHPVLLNRAPTLHRLGIQSFLPKLVEGKAILLHPLVCPAFNADFDVDQMAVHVPLSTSARAEALKLLWSRNQLLAPSSGQPLLLPTQDMVLGFYYLTISKEIDLKNWPQLFSNYLESEEFYFSNFSQAKQAHDRNLIKTHTPIWIQWSGKVQNFIPENQAKNKEMPLEIRLDLFGNCESIFTDRCQLLQSTVALQKTVFFLPGSLFVKKLVYIRTTVGRIFMYEYLSTIQYKQ
jgi:DNA-directed RNA polymerase subunit beta'